MSTGWLQWEVGFLQDAMEAAIKKAILSPDYMIPAWKVSWATLHLCLQSIWGAVQSVVTTTVEEGFSVGPLACPQNNSSQPAPLTCKAAVMPACQLLSNY